MKKMLQALMATAAVLAMAAASPPPTSEEAPAALATTSRWGEPLTAFMSACGECATRGCQDKYNWECSADSKKGTCVDWGPVACVGFVDAPLTLSGTLDASLTTDQLAATAGMSQVRDCAGSVVRRAYSSTQLDQVRAHRTRGAHYDGV